MSDTKQTDGHGILRGASRAGRDGTRWYAVGIIPCLMSKICKQHAYNSIGHISIMRYSMIGRLSLQRRGWNKIARLPKF